MKRYLKSLLALLLALSMSLSLLGTAVWAAENPDASQRLAEEVSDAREEADTEEEAPSEETSAPEAEPPQKEELPAQEEAPAAEEPAPSETEEPSEPEQVQEKNIVQEEKLEGQAPEEEALDAQDAVDYYATNLTVTNSQNNIGLRWTVPSELSSIMIKTQGVVVEGREKGSSSWTEVFSRSGSSDVRTTNQVQSQQGYWGDLKLVTRHTYEFRVYYTDGSDQGPMSNVVETVYYDDDQEKTTLQEQINEAKYGQGEVMSTDGPLTNATTLVCARPLYNLTLTLNGMTSEGNIQFHVDVQSPYKDNGFDKSDSRYESGLEFWPDGIYYIDRQWGERKYQSLGIGATQDFDVDPNDLAFGCNYIEIVMIAYGYNKFGVKEKWTETLYFDNPVGSSILTANSAVTTKDTLSFGKLAKLEENVTENGMVINYRVKGASKWSKKTFKGGSSMKITGLKANTAYEWYAQMYVKSARHDTGEPSTMWSPKTKTFTVRTAEKSKPAVKSYKISGIKYKPHKIAAHWESTGSGLKWVKEQKWTTTEYTMKITFKSVPKGVYGYWVNKDTNVSRGMVKVKGKTITVKLSTNGKAKGKKTSIYLESCTNKNGTGRSPALKYSYKVK